VACPRLDTDEAQSGAGIAGDPSRVGVGLVGLTGRFTFNWGVADGMAEGRRDRCDGTGVSLVVGAAS
jgi:hypothetical protein